MSLQERSERCDGCGADIDPDVCWCGSAIAGHSMFDNHMPVPMGCNCQRDPVAKAVES